MKWIKRSEKTQLFIRLGIMLAFFHLFPISLNSRIFFYWEIVKKEPQLVISMFQMPGKNNSLYSDRDEPNYLSLFKHL